MAFLVLKVTKPHTWVFTTSILSVLNLALVLTVAPVSQIKIRLLVNKNADKMMSRNKRLLQFRSLPKRLLVPFKCARFCIELAGLMDPFVWNCKELSHSQNKSRSDLLWGNLLTYPILRHIRPDIRRVCSLRFYSQLDLCYARIRQTPFQALQQHLWKETRSGLRRDCLAAEQRKFGHIRFIKCWKSLRPTYIKHDSRSSFSNINSFHCILQSNTK